MRRNGAWICHSRPLPASPPHTGFIFWDFFRLGGAGRGCGDESLARGRVGEREVAEASVGNDDSVSYRDSEEWGGECLMLGFVEG